MNEIVNPGDKLAAEEEMVGEDNTFAEDGFVHAAVTGEAEKDEANRAVRVKTKGRSARAIKPGDIIHGKVENIYDKVSLIHFEPESTEYAYNRNRCYLRIREVSRGFAREFRDYFHIGDYLKARVVEVKPLGLHVSIKGDDYGVIRAYCPRDRSQLDSNGKCPACGRTIRLKWAGRPEPRQERRDDRGPNRGGFRGGNRGGPRRRN